MTSVHRSASARARRNESTSARVFHVDRPFGCGDDARAFFASTRSSAHCTGLLLSLQQRRAREWRPSPSIAAAAVDRRPRFPLIHSIARADYDTKLATRPQMCETRRDNRRRAAHNKTRDSTATLIVGRRRRSRRLAARSALCSNFGRFIDVGTQKYTFITI